MHHPFIDNVLTSLSMTSPQLTAEQEAVCLEYLPLTFRLTPWAQELLEPYTYVASSPGKGFRNKLVDAFNHWLQVPPAQLNAIVRVVELLHNASLL